MLYGSSKIYKSVVGTPLHLVKSPLILLLQAFNVELNMVSQIKQKGHTKPTPDNARTSLIYRGNTNILAWFN